MKCLIYYDLLTVSRVWAKLPFLKSLPLLFTSLEWLLPRYSHSYYSGPMLPLQRGLPWLSYLTVAHVHAFTFLNRKYHHLTLYYLLIGLAICYLPRLDYNSHKGRNLSCSSLYPQHQMPGNHTSAISTGWVNAWRNERMCWVESTNPVVSHLWKVYHKMCWVLLWTSST